MEMVLILAKIIRKYWYISLLAFIIGILIELKYRPVEIYVLGDFTPQPDIIKMNED